MMRWLAPLLLAVGCGSGDRNRGVPVVLYLRRAIPSSSSFSRVSIAAEDLGTLSPEPPTDLETRACGSVVAYTMTPGSVPVDGIQLDTVLARLWWYSGNHRAYVHLGAPGIDGPLAGAPVAAAPQDDPRRVGDFTLSTLRLPISRHLSQKQAGGLYLALDATSATVRVASCDSSRSMLVLNPPHATEQSDADGDGVHDLAELESATRDPFAADPEFLPCLPEGREDKAPAFSPPAIPTTSGRLERAIIEDNITISGRILAHSGPLEIQGSLRIEAGGLVLAPGAEGRDRRPVIRVRPGGSLEIMDGSVVAPEDPAMGFSIEVAENARLRVHDSRLLYLGMIEIRRDGGVGDHAAGLLINGEDAELLRSRFIGGFEAVRVQASGVHIEDNHFERNGVAVRAEGPGGSLIHNTSLADGTFLELFGEGTGWDVHDNVALHTLDRVFYLRDGGREAKFEDNDMIDVRRGWVVGGQGDGASQDSLEQPPRSHPG